MLTATAVVIEQLNVVDGNVALVLVTRAPASVRREVEEAHSLAELDRGVLPPVVILVGQSYKSIPVEHITSNLHDCTFTYTCTCACTREAETLREAINNKIKTSSYFQL